MIDSHVIVQQANKKHKLLSSNKHAIKESLETKSFYEHKILIRQTNICGSSMRGEFCKKRCWKIWYQELFWKLVFVVV